MRVISTPLVLLAAGFCAFAAAQNDEGPFEGGVFARPLGLPYTFRENPNAHQLTPQQFDDQGKSNGLIILFNASITSAIPAVGSWLDRYGIEQAVVDGINIGDRRISDFFGQPKHARFLIEESRLPAEERRKLEQDDPYERLHQYIVLSYASVDEAKAAQLILSAQAFSVPHAVVDERVEFSGWSPNDPLFNPAPAVCEPFSGACTL